ncbi:MAG: integrase arm-type DNA-binding domain-containing protein [Variovorax sp.]
MITLMNDKPAKAPALRMRFTQQLVDALTYDAAMAMKRQSARLRPPEEPDARYYEHEHAPEATDLERSGQCSRASAAGSPSRDSQAPESVRVWDETRPGFGLRLFANGKRQYVVAARVGDVGTQRYITLSPPSEAYSLKQARKDAAHKLQKLRDGEDCSAKGVKAQEPDDALTVTLRTVFERYVDANSSRGTPLRARTIQNYSYILEHYLYQIAGKPAASITRAMCKEIYLSISKGTFVPPPSRADAQDGAPPPAREMRGPARTTANGVMRMLRTMLEWARMQYRDEKAQFRILGLNPVDSMFQETPRNRETPCDGRIPEEKLGTVYRALRWQSAHARSPVARTAADWLQFRLLTPARTTESAQLRFGDIDFVGDRLVLPGDVTKNCYPYRLPLNDPLRELLECPRRSRTRPPRRLNTRPGVEADAVMVGCG